ncbi:MAG: serine/threonine protein kinase [Myxococcales bacterium]|nr:serine/threonine protein kinase [Myxococcales bacterium]
MRDEHGSLEALCRLGEQVDPDERTRIWRHAISTLSSSEVAPSALERLDPLHIMQGIRVALATGQIRDLDWLPSAPAYLALYHLASVLPPGTERRDLGRMVLEKFRQCDAQTFVQLADRLALGARDAFSEPSVRLRLGAEFIHCPLQAAHTRVLARLALTMIARSELREAWLVDRSMGSLTSRRVAARMLELAARHATYLTGTDNGPMAVLTGAQVSDVMARLLLDREPLVWRHAAIARGLLALHDTQLATSIQNELDGGNTSAWRHGATSLASMLERQGHAAKPRLVAAIDRICHQDAGVSRAFLMGLEGALLTFPDLSDDLACHIVLRGGLDAALGLAELRRALGDVAPRATSNAIANIEQHAWQGRDPSEQTLLDDTALQLDLTVAPSTLCTLLAAARDGMRNGDAELAVKMTTLALGEMRVMLTRLQAADLSPHDELLLLVDIDRELLTDSMIHALLALTTASSQRLGKELEDILVEFEHILMAAEHEPVMAHPVPHETLRMWRLRALLRLIDRDALDIDNAAGRARRIATVIALARRAAQEQSSLQRLVSAAMMRAWDALLRDQALDVTELLFATATLFDPHYDVTALCQATRYPHAARLLANYAALTKASWAISGPRDVAALEAAVEAARVLVEELPIAVSARADALRLACVRFVEAIAGLTRSSTIAVANPFIHLLAAASRELAALASGSARRLGLPELGALGTTIGDVAITATRPAAHQNGEFSDAVADAGGALREGLLPAFGNLAYAALVTYAALPVGDLIAATAAANMPAGGKDRWMRAIDASESVELPDWMPLSRIVGGFLVERALGSGNSGSVFVARRRGKRNTDNPDDTVAVKVPDFDSGVARNLTQHEFERLFREEAGALLALPNHVNLARFISFDATAKPKPILVMEYVRGPTLEQLLDSQRMDITTALSIADDIAAGLLAMHDVNLAHLDLKPANVVIRHFGTPRARAVLVDFGLAGRQLRRGCGSPHYGAPEVWGTPGARTSPLPTDVYAFACLAYELCTGQPLVVGSTLQGVLGKHLAGTPAKDAYWRFATKLGAPHLADVLAASLSRDPAGRPPITVLKQALLDHHALFAASKWPL